MTSEALHFNVLEKEKKDGLCGRGDFLSGMETRGMGAWCDGECMWLGGVEAVRHYWLERVACCWFGGMGCECCEAVRVVGL
jgi:hypothetical protein